MENLFGLTRGKLFGEPPLYVDKERKPGMTDMPKPTVYFSHDGPTQTTQAPSSREHPFLARRATLSRREEAVL